MAFQTRGSNLDLGQDVTGTLSQNCDSASGGAPCISIALRGRDSGATAELGDDVAFALRASGGGGDKPHVLAFDCKASGQSGFGVGEIAGTMRAMGHANTHQNGGGHSAVAYGSAVRRLTPRECERLQGFQFLVSPDYPQAWQDDAGRWWSPDYTAIPVRKVTAANQSKARADDSGMFREIDGEMWIMASDGPRYKSLGNSWAMPKFRWLGRRIQRLMPPRR